MADIITVIAIIGLATVTGLSWVLAVSMGAESDAEKRRLDSSPTGSGRGETKDKRAA
jgi:hypothetical protein